MKLIIGAIFALGALVPIGAGYRAHQQSTASGIVRAPDVSLQPELAPPRLTEAQALAIVRADQGPQLLTLPYSAEYGSFAPLGHESIRTSNGVVPVPRRDVWKFTFTGVNISRPCMGPGACPPNAHTLVIFIDDKTGQQNEAEAW